MVGEYGTHEDNCLVVERRQEGERISYSLRCLEFQTKSH